LLAAVGSAVVALSIPVALLEHVATASGIGAVLPLFADPIDLGARIVLALLAALAAAALVWSFWGTDDAIGKAGHMKQARKLSASYGWEALMRRVRGRGEDDPAQAVLARRRRDRHPDAPPRPPLFASRDLPAPDGAADDAPAEAAALPSPVPAPAPMSGMRIASPVVTEPCVDLPRSPPPMSEEEIARLLGGPQAPATLPESAPPRHGLSPSLIEAVRALDLPEIEGADLAALSARFESGVARRALLRQAWAARTALEERIADATPDAVVRAALRAQRPLDVVAAPQPPADGAQTDSDVEHALENALAALRRLTEQGRRQGEH